MVNLQLKMSEICLLHSVVIIIIIIIIIIIHTPGSKDPRG